MKAELTRLAERAAEEGLLDVAYTTTDSPFGQLLLARTPRGLVRVGLPNQDAERAAGRALRRRSRRGSSRRRRSSMRPGASSTSTSTAASTASTCRSTGSSPAASACGC